MLLTLVLILSLIFSVSGIIILWFELQHSNLKIEFIEKNLFNFSKKINDLEISILKSKLKNSTDEKTSPQKNETKTQMVMGEWQTKNKNKAIINPTKKRKSKTVTEWEEDFDLGGHE